jgi:hypothetical protein
MRTVIRVTEIQKHALLVGGTRVEARSMAIM